jgi:hypothetical protein
MIVIVLIAALTTVITANEIHTKDTACEGSEIPNKGANLRAVLLSIKDFGDDKTDKNGTTATSEIISKVAFKRIETNVTKN